MRQSRADWMRDWVLMLGNLNEKLDRKNLEMRAELHSPESEDFIFLLARLVIEFLSEKHPHAHQVRTGFSKDNWAHNQARQYFEELIQDLEKECDDKAELHWLLSSFLGNCLLPRMIKPFFEEFEERWEAHAVPIERAKAVPVERAD